MAEKTEKNITGVVQEYGDRLFRFIRGRVSTNLEAEDILQEVWHKSQHIFNVFF